MLKYNKIDTDGNLAALRKYEAANDATDMSMECVIERAEDARTAAIDAIADYVNIMQSESDEFGLSHDWWDLQDDLEISWKKNKLKLE